MKRSPLWRWAFPCFIGLLGGCTETPTPVLDAAVKDVAPRMDGVTPPDQPFEGGLLDQTAEIVSSDLPDVSRREDVIAPDDMPVRETAIDDGSAVDGEARDALADRASPACVVGRFEAPPARHALPGGYPTRTFTSAGESSSCTGGGGRPGYLLLDLNADRRPDLVVTRACDDDAVGSDHWRVYLNSGSTFAGTATRFSLPGGYLTRTFTTAGESSSCTGGVGRPGYAFFDADGDQRPDLVVTRACDDTAVGSDHWRVYLNTGSAFAATATRFALPSGYTGSGFTSAGAASSCSSGAGRPGYALYDMNADQRPDLVVTRACDDDAVGSDHWRVYLSTGSSFAGTATRFALPSGYMAGGFTSAGATSSCSGGAGRPGYALYDMNADQRPDLVVSRACDDDAVGSDHWRIYLNSGSAFASTATRFALPSGYTGSGFTSSGATSSCSGGAGRPGYALYDMNGDQRPDLVVTRACEDDAVGSDHWRVHLNVCM